MLLTFCPQVLAELSFQNSLELPVGFLFSFIESMKARALNLKRRAEALEQGSCRLKIQSFGHSEPLGKLLPLSESWFPSQIPKDNISFPRMGF